MKFEMNDREYCKAALWINKQIAKNNSHGGCSGGRFTYSFTPTSLGLATEVTDNVTKETCNVTDYENW